MMLPMVTEVSEIRQVRELMQKEIQHISKFGHQLPKKLQFGAMLEVPALLWQLDELMDEVDFVSVGSNDLSSSRWPSIVAMPGSRTGSTCSAGRS